MISGCQLFRCDKPAPVASDYSQVGGPLCWLSLSQTWHPLHARCLMPFVVYYVNIDNLA